MAKSKPLKLSAEERNQLENITRTRTLQSQVVTRARILLLKSDGDSVDKIADKVGINQDSILLCLKRYKSGGISSTLPEGPQC